jgi:hypothetical protein
MEVTSPRFDYLRRGRTVSTSSWLSFAFSTSLMIGEKLNSIVGERLCIVPIDVSD